MNQFRELKFNFDGESSDKYSMYFVSVGDISWTTKFGLDRSTNKSEGVRTSYLIGTNKSDVELSFTLGKMDVNGRPLRITQKDLDDLNRWLIKEDYKPLICNDRVVYGVFTKIGEVYINAQGLGYVNLTFETTGNVYSNVVEVPYVVTNTKTVILENKSTINDWLPMDVDIELYDNASKITITNVSTNKKIVIDGLTDISNKHIYLDSENRHVHNRTRGYYDEIMIDFIKNEDLYFPILRYGQNRIKIDINGKGKVIFKYQNELAFT